MMLQIQSGILNTLYGARGKVAATLVNSGVDPQGFHRVLCNSVKGQGRWVAFLAVSFAYQIHGPFFALIE